MAKLNESYYCGVDQYSDGDVENEILQMVRQGKGLDSLQAEKASYPIIYHLSKVRQNIFLWYPFAENARILEVGAGCGAVTGILCEKAKEVVAVELSRRRASINYERNRQHENLEIIVANLNDIPVMAEFDYIILNGVFEYAGGFTEGEQPYETFLEGISQRLKPNGTILIAIENRLGAKYLAGAPEDHTERYFLGLNQYEGVNAVKTFSKGELTELCERVGLVCSRFYYPYPDYKFPYEIFTDETINTSMYGRPMFQFHERRLGLFSEAGFCQTLAKEGVADRFANSFLVEVRKKYVSPEKKITYVKLNTDRREAFRIYTVIWEQGDKRYVTKYQVGEGAGQHLKDMQHTEGSGEGWHYLEGSPGEESITFPFLQEHTLDDEITGLLSERDRQGIADVIQRFYQEFLGQAREQVDYHNEEFCRVFGEAQCEGPQKCCKNLDIDLIFDNIFCLGEQYAVIDAEWVFPFDVPVAYVMWRVLNELYYKHPTLEQAIERRLLEETYGIRPEDAVIFKQWEIHFAYSYVGSYGLQRYENKLLYPNMEAIASWYSRDSWMESKLYFDTGKGYNEEETSAFRVALTHGHFVMDVPIPSQEEMVNLRWDPVNAPCKCRIIQARAGNQDIRCIPLNSFKKEEDMDVFLTSDPNYGFTGQWRGAPRLFIEGELWYLSQSDLEQELGKLSQGKKHRFLEKKKGAWRFLK